MEGALARFAHRHPTASPPSPRSQKPRPLDLSAKPKHDPLDPWKRTLSGRLQIGMVAGFILECMAGFVGIRTVCPDVARSTASDIADFAFS
jgi:hypothetical protein